MDKIRGKFLTIHGIDGTGKTSTTIRIVKKLNDAGIPAVNYDLYKETVKNPYSEKKKQADESGSLEERLATYLESMMYHSNEIDSLLSKGFHVVKSRYLDDIKAHFSHLGLSQEKIKEFEEKFPMVQPDLKVILVLDEDERHKRINVRGILDGRDLDEKNVKTRLGFFEDYLLKLLQQKPDNSKLKVDTTNLNVEQIVKRIMDHLLKKYK